MSVTNTPTVGPVTQDINGVRHTILLSPENVKRALQFEPHDGDIILVGSYRSGCHWMQQIIQLILNKKESAKTYEEFMKLTPIIEFQGKEAVESLPAPRFLRTHLPLGQIPFSKKAKYVYIARNPWDILVSTYRLLKEMPHVMLDKSFDDYITLITSADRSLGFGDPLTHVLSAYSRREEPNLFFITYEEMQADTRGTVMKLANFLGEEYGKALAENELLETVLRDSSVDSMRSFCTTTKQHVSTLLCKNPDLQTTASGASSEGEVDAVHFVREGKSGGWRKVITRDQLLKLERKLLSIPQGSDIINLWRDDWLYAQKAART